MKRIAVILLVTIVLLYGGYEALIYYVNLPSGVVLSKEQYVADGWTEIDIKPAVRAENRSQNITVSISNIEWGAKHDGLIHLNDGTSLGPELELVDEGGLVQPLVLSGFTQKYGIDANYRAAKDTLGFSENRKFVKLRIRSSQPFVADKIVWKDYNPK
ncbi:MAG TPA: hypothetical protein PKA82_08540 [Pyrinomonadaceae bacterium]|nr:hypothetical protein [Pyrinomonadaceae bacterium]